MSRYSRLALLLAVIATPVMLRAAAPAVHAAASASRPRAEVQVTIQGFAFSPAKITVAPGTKVTWTNKDSVAHTVTSDKNAWTDSGSIANGAHFSFTFSKPGTYTYHCAIHPTMVATVVVSSGSTGGGNGGTMHGMGMGSMGPMGMTSMKTWTGYYDGHKVLYLSTDTTSKSEAMQERINYAPGLAATLPSSSKIYLIMNGRFASRSPAFGSEPGEKDYTPLWQEVQVSWKNPSKAVFLGSDNDINAMAKAGKVTLKLTGVVLNCPIIKVMTTNM